MTGRATWLVLLLPLLGCGPADAPGTPAAPASSASSATSDSQESPPNTTSDPAAAPAAEEDLAAASAATPQSQPASGSPGTVVVVGDATAADVVKELRQGEISVTDDKSQVGSAGLIVVAQDATQGPTPVHKELAPEIAKNKGAKVLWVLTNTAKIDDAELLELFELEIRELMSSHNYPGDSIQLAVDTETTSVAAQSPTLKGWPAIRQLVSGKPASE